MERFEALRVIHATHCHFENPFDMRCEWACGSLEPEQAADAVMNTIRTLATAWVLEHALGYPRAGAMLEAAENGTGNWTGHIEDLP
jgi:hypothetical protein